DNNSSNDNNKNNNNSSDTTAQVTFFAGLFLLLTKRHILFDSIFCHAVETLAGKLCYYYVIFSFADGITKSQTLLKYVG
ncbi:Uncharacterized protein FWK35_00012750, partial [Aphis craccivora]